MSTILRIDSSPRGRNAHSGRFADELMTRLQARMPNVAIERRALFDAPPALVDEDFTKVMTTHTTAELARETAALGVSETLIGELEASDVLVIATPVHNFSVPAPLKAWIDQVVRFGRSFKSTPAGKIGLLRDRPTWIVASSGGYFSNGAARQPDFFQPYLEAILATIGIHDVGFIRLEGLSRGEAAVEAAYASARQAVDRRLAAADAG